MNEQYAIRFWASDPFGGGNLRSFWPAEALREIRVKAVADVGLPTTLHGEPDCDVLVMHRPLGLDGPKIVEEFQRKGVKVWIDEDDDLSRINETKNEIGLQEWVPERVAAHDECMKRADGVVVSTFGLAEVYGELNPNVVVCRNMLPRRYASIRRYGKRTFAEPKVGWMGITQTHVHDLEWIRPQIRAALNGSRFVTVGDKRTPRLLGIPGSDIDEFQPTPDQLYKLTAKADIGIVPLLPCAFNESKSWLKALEYMTVGVPVVATSLPEQRDLITDGVDGLLARTPEEFAERVQLLIWDIDVRVAIAAAAHARAKQLAIERHVGQWLPLLEDLP